MKAVIEIELVPFKVPDKVAVKGNAELKQVGFEENRSIHVSELDVETLNQLCDEFKRNVMIKAGKIEGRLIEPEEQGKPHHPPGRR